MIENDESAPMGSDAIAETTVALPLRRLGAMIYELLPLAALAFFASTGAVWLAGGSAVPSGDLRLQASIVALWCLYFVLSWRFGGQTLAMRAWRLEIRCRDGHELDVATAARRLVVATLGLLIAGLGHLWVLGPRRMTWHDSAAGTQIYLLPKSK